MFTEIDNVVTQICNVFTLKILGWPIHYKIRRSFLCSNKYIYFKFKCNPQNKPGLRLGLEWQQAHWRSGAPSLEQEDLRTESDSHCVAACHSASTSQTNHFKQSLSISRGPIWLLSLGPHIKWDHLFSPCPLYIVTSFDCFFAVYLQKHVLRLSILRQH